ncbi:transcriptional regulator [Nocardioides sp. SOB44]|uniref:Transcriptional regulator n=1 Tax=Nocardioides cremeus TaxID=3058044 RepID=A0ABT8TVW4_9ACTN|nr:transcriptional regulator [Nocardioides cremeus]MDO3398094.1 transcriptional regulator [Nocardioides cremeus]
MDSESGRSQHDHLVGLEAEVVGSPASGISSWALLQGATSVNCPAELVHASPSGVSQHVAEMRPAGLVHGRRGGTYMDYAAGSSHVRALLEEALFQAAHADRGLNSEVPHSHATGRSALNATVR